MWRRTYLLLLAVRLYFALQPSFIHPDENFQGPEVFAGRVFGFPSKLTWEFTSDHPIRSIFPIWLTYGLPMTLLKWVWAETVSSNPPPQLVYYTLRITMFLLSLVLEDWAIHELVPNPRNRRRAVVLVASSFVTWVHQSHTFSNSIETLLVAWSLVLIQRVVENKQRSSVFTCVMLSLVAVVGVFNRITFPAFIIVPAIQLIPHFWHKPYSLIATGASALFFIFAAIMIDTSFYKPASFFKMLISPVVTPFNNVAYNSQSSNLAIHGIHPRYQHFVVNFPQLLGPAYFLAIWSVLTKRTQSTIFSIRNMRTYSALCGAAAISIFPHQEARFLMPCVPLLLSSFRPPRSRLFLASWVIFNALLGLLMGVYHQAGVVPTQLHMPELLAHAIPPVPMHRRAITKITNATSNTNTNENTATVLWWKTYCPPHWLLGDSRTNFTIVTDDLGGMARPKLRSRLDSAIPKHRCTREKNPLIPAEDGSSPPRIRPNMGTNLTFFVGPHSNPYLDQFISGHDGDDTGGLRLHQLWEYKRHVNMDDFDPGEDGIVGALKRVFGRRGLVVWLLTREC